MKHFFSITILITILGSSLVQGKDVSSNGHNLRIDIFEKLFGGASKIKYVSIKTEQGEAIVKLYNETPLHRDNFLKLAKKGYFNGTLFHRVIPSFMIQGGDPDSRNAAAGRMLGDGGPEYTVPAEFNDSLFHKKGALAAARDDNPARASSGSQFYLVQGKTYTDEELDRVEKVRLKGRKLPEKHRAIYKTLGGAPFLDQSYTVFGEVVKGYEMVDAVAGAPRDQNDRPLLNIAMQVTVLKNRDVRRLEKQLKQDAFRNKLIMK
ncbi:peptidyl-prolyl cis-trans isomerase B (cyclophilin B) [Arcticibacter pallidicorallinus]|uniref:peptidylprolyl isomerase n=1 Tax=Arcticibacter pallidicorallinus TaxID=1259464 RepID=A0A2T0U7L1_9SPHI|nr:peptidylprolyl isomerase [Arcticibacter pallidicorallinus]PRY53905.1 peptidyl-prolyl cis-trans isomerase B (cyclophilin B) [Arcticibacter pallidicorallinus]